MGKNWTVQLEKKYSVGEFRKLCNIDAEMYSNTYKRFTYATKNQNMASDLSIGADMIFDRIYIMLAPSVVTLVNSAGSLSFYHVRDVIIDEGDGSEKKSAIRFLCDNPMCSGGIMEHTLIAENK